MVVQFSSVSATEILDSRGRPTLHVRIALADNVVVTAGVPSGASTGTREAVELRDGDSRFGGQGVTRAVANVNGPIADVLTGRGFETLAAVDAAVCGLDGTADKSRLGANAIVGVSMAAARAFAVGAGQQLWQWLTPADTVARQPVPHFNIVNGGAHAQNPLDFQEFMIAPIGAPSLPDAVRAGAEIYARLRNELSERGFATGLGDEGGFAPDIDSPEQVLTLIVKAILDAGYLAGRDGVAIALDPAASQFYRDGRYEVAGESLTAGDLTERYAAMTTDFPIWSIEDGMAEDDAAGWQTLTAALGARVQLVGDDNLVTNPALIASAIQAGIGNAALIKVNQIGSVTETLEALRVCRDAGYGAMVSHRSGETDDAFIADLAVGSGCGQLKSGAPARGERVAKYNRLLEIADTAADLPFGLPA